MGYARSFVVCLPVLLRSAAFQGGTSYAGVVPQWNVHLFACWQRCMGVEPTHDRTGGRATILKLAAIDLHMSAYARRVAKNRAFDECLVWGSSPMSARVGVN